MKNYILISGLFFFACNSQMEKKSTIVNSTEISADTLINRESERFFPETKGFETFDTLIVDKQLQITITKNDLDSYVKFEYNIDGNKQIDKYRDAEITLTIKQNAQTLLDTVFRKKQFSKYTDKGFIDIAIFHNYWFRNLDKDKIEFFGVISKPETDYTLAFSHYFDLKNKKLTFVESVDEE